MAILALPMVFALGYANQRGSTCAVAAADQLVWEGRFSKIAGFAVAAGVSALGMLALGLHPQAMRPAGWLALAGGAVVALGSSINGRCAMGTIASLSTGNLARLATVSGFFLGALLVHLSGLMPPMASAVSSAGHGATPALLAMAGLGIGWHFARRGGSAHPGWMVLIGALNVGLTALAPHWTYTGRLVAIAGGERADLPMLLASLAALIAGGVLAAGSAGTLRLRQPAAAELAKSGLGGILMGCGAFLIPGGNDTMLLAGVPLGLTYLLLAYAAFIATLVLLRYLKARKTKVAGQS